MRLMNGTEFVVNQIQGRVEVCIGNTYFTVCNDFWDALEANVVCNHLGHNTSSMSQQMFTVLVYLTMLVVIKFDNFVPNKL